MRRRERVPAALHSELTEYASLLRALRASHTLDLSQNLLQQDPYTTPPHSDNGSEAGDIAANDEDDDAVDDADDLSDNAHVPPVTGSPISGDAFATSITNDDQSGPTAKKRKRSRASEGHRPKKKAQRSLWSRWPLLLKDVPVPEWSLEDEVAQITETLLRTSRLQEDQAEPTPSTSRSRSASSSPSSQQEGQSSDTEETEEEESTTYEPEDEATLHEEIEQYVPHLTRMTTNYLSTILSHLVVNTPKRPPSLQNRAVPIDWRFLLDTLWSSANPELADPEIIEKVRKRLEEEYGSQPADESPKRRDGLYQHRMERRAVGRRMRHEKLSNPAFSYLTLASPPEKRAGITNAAEENSS